MVQLVLLLHKSQPLVGRDYLRYVVLLAFIVLAGIYYAIQPKKQKYAAAPIACIVDRPLAMARERFKADAQGMLREGYERYKGQPFYVPSPLGERLMIPNKYVEELKTAPVDEVDFVGTFYEVYYSISGDYFL